MARKKVRGAGGGLRPWDSGARASRTALPARAARAAASRIPAHLPPNLFSRDPRPDRRLRSADRTALRYTGSTLHSTPATSLF